MDRDSTEAGTWRERAYPWYAAVLFMLVYLCSAVDRMVISVVTEPLKHAFHLSDGQIGILAGVAFSAPFAIASLPMGWLVDRLNRCLLLAGIMTVWSLSTMLGAIPLGYHFLLSCRMLVGAAEAGAHPACLSLIADFFPPNRRATAVSIFATGTALASYIVYLVGGWLVVNYSWHAVFLLAGIPGILLAILTLITLREPPRGRYDTAGPDGLPERKLTLRETSQLILRTRPMLHAITAHMLATGVQWAIVTFIVALMTRVHGLSLGQATVWVGVAIGTFQTIGSLGSGPIIDWIGRGSTRTLAGWLTCMAIACLVAGMGVLYAPTAEFAIAALCVQTLCAGMLTGPSYALLIATSPARARGSSISLARLISSLIGNSGLGFFAGFVSDLVGGPDSIRVGLAATMLFFAWSSFHYLMVRRLVAKESDQSTDALVQA